MRLGEGVFSPRLPPPPPPEPTDRDVLLEILNAILYLRAALPLEQVAPVIEVAAPDLTDIVTAVNGLKPGVDAEDIAAAIREQLAPHLTVPDDGAASVFADLAKALEKIEFRLQATQQAFGASGPSNIASDPNRLLGHVTVDNPTGSVDVTDRPTRALGHVIPDPPSYRLGRTYVTRVQALATASRTLYNVNTPKKLWVTQITVVFYNTSSIGGSQLTILDFSTPRVSLALPMAQATLVPPLTTYSAYFSEPLEFTTDFTVTVANGTPSYTCSFVGYEE